MILTRPDTAATLDLPDDLHWQDEPWSPVVQRVEWSLTGALIVEEATKLAGRPMTLAGYSNGGEQGGTITLSTATALLAWSAVPNLEMTLARIGITHTLTWRHEGDGAVTYTPVFYWLNTTGDAALDPLQVPVLRFWVL